MYDKRGSHTMSTVEECIDVIEKLVKEAKEQLELKNYYIVLWCCVGLCLTAEKLYNICQKKLSEERGAEKRRENTLQHT